MIYKVWTNWRSLPVHPKSESRTLLICKSRCVCLKFVSLSARLHRWNLLELVNPPGAGVSLCKFTRRCVRTESIEPGLRAKVDSEISNKMVQIVHIRTYTNFLLKIWISGICYVTHYFCWGFQSKSNQIHSRKRQLLDEFWGVLCFCFRNISI